MVASYDQRHNYEMVIGPTEHLPTATTVFTTFGITTPRNMSPRVRKSRRMAKIVPDFDRNGHDV